MMTFLFKSCHCDKNECIIESLVSNFFCKKNNFQIKELKTLYKLIEHEYISYENEAAHAVINKIVRIIKENDK